MQYGIYDDNGIFIKIYDHTHPGDRAIVLTDEQAEDINNYRVNMTTNTAYMLPSCPLKYWKMVNGAYTEMTTTEKEIVDANEIITLKQSKSAGFYQQTMNHIESVMPQWRLNRWRRYYDIAQKVMTSGYSALNMIEKSEYDSFPDPGETHETCMVYVPACLQWTVDCITAHKTAEVELQNATTVDEIAAVVVQYPTYPA
jgi:hypothetical protein